MLPPGHIAAGYLTAEALLKISHFNLSLPEQTKLIWWGTFFSFAPDLDTFVVFILSKSWWKQKLNHRKLYSHIPILWFFAGFLLFCFSSTNYGRCLGLLLWLCSWSHFLLDSIELGVMWLWPFNLELWALKDRGVEIPIEGKGFLEYWINFLKFYFRSWTFYCEILIILTALIIYFK